MAIERTASRGHEEAERAPSTLSAPSIPPRPVYDACKRTFDVASALVAIVVLLPLLLCIAGAIAVTSGSPVLYRGVRIGRYGRPFRILKFRTMILNAERAGTTTTLGDPRITSVGRILRRAKLDELPQLFNVLAGEMSFVGPRPEVAEHTDAYTEAERVILCVRPGITDYASIHFVSLDQVLGTVDPHQVYVTRVRAEKNALRVRYVRERSFGVDLRILAGTAAAIWRKLSGGAN